MGTVEEHVGICLKCQRILQQLIGSVTDVLGSLPEVKGSEPDDIAPELPGYVPLGRIDAGGMGVVWRFRDVEFQRTVAIKVMRSKWCDRPHLLRRFLAEARITGQLSHPSIVPVHAKGTLADGRPYFTMKLIEGETLAARLKNRPNSHIRQLELVRVFAQVCQAVAQAHSRRVIHRDLKPANVMVGLFGEVQVMDWGLAKVLSDEGEFDLPPPSSLSGEESDITGPEGTTCETDHDTRPGTVMGTSPYMPPEQARGEVNLLGPSCDVFSLGAILCEILTGQPPYRGASRGEVFRQAANGDLADAYARLDACGADEELVLLAKACLVPKREERIADAGVIAGAIATYEAGVAERLRQVEVERAEAQVRVQEERKRRRLASVLAVLVLVGLVGLATGTAVLARKNGQLTTANADLDTARTEAVKKGEQAVRARDRTFDALDSMTSGVTGESLETQPAITKQQKKFLATVINSYQEFAQEQGDDEATRKRVAAAAYRVGLIQYRLGLFEPSIQAFEQARDRYQALATDFPYTLDYDQDWASSLNNLGILYHETGKLADSEAVFRQAIAIDEKLADAIPEEPRIRRLLAGYYNNLALLLSENKKRPEDTRHAYQQALALRQKLATDFPKVAAYRQDLATVQSNFATFLMDLAQPREAEESLRLAMGIRQKLVDEVGDDPEYRHDLADSYYNLGGLLRRQNSPVKAEEAYQTAIATRQKLADEFPGVLRYRHELAVAYGNLGMLHLDEGKLSEGEKAIRQAIGIHEKTATEFPLSPEARLDLINGRIALGALLRKRHQWPEAEAFYRKALVDCQLLAEEFPHSLRFRQTLAGCHNNLGRLFGEMNKWPEAEVAYRRSFEVRQQLAKEHPLAPECQHDLASISSNLGDALAELEGRAGEAFGAYDEARKIWEGLAKQFPDAIEYRHDLAACYNNLGEQLRALGKPREAKAAYLQAMEVWEKLVADFRRIPQFQINLAANQVNFGNGLRRDGEAAEAVTWYDKAIVVLKPFVEAKKGPPVARFYLRTAHWGRAEALSDLKRYPEAVGDWDRALELAAADDKTTIRLSRASWLLRAGQVAQAVAEADDLAKSMSIPAPQIYNLACLHALAAGKDEANRERHVGNALRLLRRAVKEGFDDVLLVKTDEDLNSLHGHEEFRKLLAELEAAKEKKK